MKKLSTIFFILCLCFTAATAQTTYAPFYDAPKESYVKSMRSVFKDLYYREWENAQRDYDKVLEKSNAKSKRYTNTQLQALYPLPEVAQSIMLSTEGTMIPTWTVDYNKAYSFLKQAISFPERTKLDAFLADPDINVNLNVLEDKIESKLCQQATTANTEAAYDAVIDSLLPQSLRLQAMKSQREELAFTAVMKNPTEAECQRFLTKYTNAMPSRKLAVSRDLDSLRFYSFQPTIENLRNYIKQYPKSSFAQLAADTLETLEYQHIDTTAASCLQFMESYPTSKYVMTVKKRYEKYAYSEALTACTTQTYLSFCKALPYDLRYQSLFDSLLTKTVRAVYDTVFAGKQPDNNAVLSKAFCENIQRVDSAYQQMIEKGLIPPRRKCIWYGLRDSIETKPFNHLDITNIDLKSKILAVVRIHLSNNVNADVLALQASGTGADDKDKANASSLQTDAELYFIFEDKKLKIDDIRFADGSSMKQGG